MSREQFEKRFFVSFSSSLCCCYFIKNIINSFIGLGDSNSGNIVNITIVSVSFNWRMAYTYSQSCQSDEQKFLKTLDGRTDGWTDGRTETSVYELSSNGQFFFSIEPPQLPCTRFEMECVIDKCRTNHKFKQR